MRPCGASSRCRDRSERSSPSTCSATCFTVHAGALRGPAPVLLAEVSEEVNELGPLPAQPTVIKGGDDERSQVHATNLLRPDDTRTDSHADPAHAPARRTSGATCGRSGQHGPVDADVRTLVESEWASRLGLSPPVLRRGGVHVVATELGANDAMSFLLDKTCVVVVPPEEVETATAMLSGLDPQAAFTAETLGGLVGPGTLVEGPSSHSYAGERTFRGSVDDAVQPIDGADDGLLAFLETNDLADWAESGFPLDPASADPDTTRFWVLLEGGHVVAAGNMTEWRHLPADVGVLTHPGDRGRGLGARLVATMVAATLPLAGVVRYRALATNRRSLAVARRLGFESFGQNYRARRHTH